MTYLKHTVLNITTIRIFLSALSFQRSFSVSITNMNCHSLIHYDL